MTKSNYKTRLKDIKVFVLDVDGVLTNGDVILESSGEMVRTMNTRDGYAVQHAIKQGFDVWIITGGNSTLVEKRMRYLGVSNIHLAVKDKLTLMLDLCKENALDPSNLLYMGDDLPDYECLMNVGISSCPKDATQEIRSVVDYISHYDGGKGAVRDVIEQTLKIHNKWFNKDAFTTRSV